MNFKFIFTCNVSKAEVRSAWNPSVSGIVLTKCFTCISVVFDLFCIKLFMFKHWQEFKYKMLAVTIHLADYVRCLSFERWWHCHQKKQHSDKFKEDSWGHDFTATPPSQRQKKPTGQYTLSKKDHVGHHFAAERAEKKNTGQILYSTNYISLFLFMVLFLSSWIWSLATILCRLLNVLSCHRNKHNLLENWPIFSSMIFFPLISLDENITHLCTVACVMLAGVCCTQVKEHLSAGWNVLL